ncbi:hypothetical protein DSM19430T_09190 [Desulfovibrio psychrotolerans]|uniref:BMC domain-containing protein n=2 Tax=Desulfovibrio psychrotolerans TaxID=415242 RepID=A0A7J0BSX1_9BACT|nr:hypothetical protein DSM19430T_09190 [Desulfovibrio psychrotolerans]
MTALGLIETKGLLAAVEGADAMLKAADVRLLERNMVGGGLVTITVAGEVSAVSASVEAAVAAIGRIDGAALVSGHVIARPDAEIATILALHPATDAAQAAVCCASAGPAVKASAQAAVPAADGVKVPETTAGKTAGKGDAATPARYEISQLKKMNVGRLRQVARSLKGVSLTADELTTAAKKDLIDAIINAYRQIEE